MRVNEIDFRVWRLGVECKSRSLLQRREEAKERKGKSDGGIGAARDVGEGSGSTDAKFKAGVPPIFYLQVIKDLLTMGRAPTENKQDEVAVECADARGFCICTFHNT